MNNLNTKQEAVLNGLFYQVAEIQNEAMTLTDSEDLIDAAEDVKALKPKLEKYGKEEIVEFALSNIYSRMRFLAEFS